MSQRQHVQYSIVHNCNEYARLHDVISIINCINTHKLIDKPNDLDLYEMLRNGPSSKS